jgi:hypothetical protein
MSMDTKQDSPMSFTVSCNLQTAVISEMSAVSSSLMSFTFEYTVLRSFANN